MNSLNEEDHAKILNMKDEYNFELIIDYLDSKVQEEQDVNYERQFPKVFYLEDYDSKISVIIEKLYGFVKTNTDIDMLIRHMNQTNSMMKPNDCDDDNLIGFMLLFCFDYFQLVHMCLRDIYKYNNITEESSEKIKNKLNTIVK
jgi:hypothetical protein